MGCGLTKEPPPRLTDNERRFQAILMIQRWYRRHQARIVMKRNCNWAIFEEIEYAGEQDQHKLYEFFSSCLKVLPNHAKFLPSKLNGFDKSEGVFDDIEIEDSYCGVHLKFPLTLRSLKNMLESFKASQPLHAKYVMMVVKEAKSVLQRQPNINHISTQSVGEVTVCGDIHGRLDDLLIIFYKNGLPSCTNPYIFNGDFVDRGKYSVEVLLILFTLLIIYPNAVYLNRGNHEDYVLNIKYGFASEVIKKYGENSRNVMRAFRDVFRFLPLGCVVNQKVLVVHGGISSKTNLLCIERLERHKLLSVLKPQGTNEDGAEEEKERHQVLDLLWSDPRLEDGCVFNESRGGGASFGADVTKSVLQKNGFDLLVRSHQCMKNGYKYTHGSMVLTVFSASNYYGINTNFGAYVKLSGKGKPHCVQFQAKRMAKGLTIRQQVSSVEESALHELREKLLLFKERLLDEYTKRDNEKNGLISIEDWVAVTGAVTQLSVPWRILKRQLVSMKSGKVEYSSGFEQNGLANHSVGITETLYWNRKNLETVFRIIDQDNSGYLSVEEFKATCVLLREHTGINFPENFAEDIVKSMDFDRDGRVNLNEFLESFRIVDKLLPAVN
eukprot:m.19411 g.19411  ORF g.19411 m.19411 type:complete len:610 (+) comp27834_c0_seq5:50-1879(+)